MKMTKLTMLLGAVHTLALAVCLAFMVMRPAQAYLDPGSGSYALQLGVAGLFGALFSLKLMWRRIADAVAKTFAVRRAENAPVNR